MTCNACIDGFRAEPVLQGRAPGHDPGVALVIDTRLDPVEIAFDQIGRQSGLRRKFKRTRGPQRIGIGSGKQIALRPQTLLICNPKRCVGIGIGLLRWCRGAHDMGTTLLVGGRDIGRLIETDIDPCRTLFDNNHATPLFLCGVSDILFSYIK